MPSADPRRLTELKGSGTYNGFWFLTPLLGLAPFSWGGQRIQGRTALLNGYSASKLAARSSEPLVSVWRERRFL